MRKLLLALLILGALSAHAQSSVDAVEGFCDLGATSAQVSGLGSTNKLQGIIPGCTVTVYLTGTQNLATIYANGTGTPLSNPFTATTTTSGNTPGGHWIFWAVDGQGYDVVGSGGTAPNNYPNPIALCTDCKVGGGSGGEVSYEWLSPLWSTTCAYPATCTDLVATALPVDQSYVLRGQYPSSVAAANVIQDVSCSLQSVGACSVTLSTPLPGSYIVSSISTVEGIDVPDTFTFTSSAGSYTTLDTVCSNSCINGLSPWADAEWQVPAAGVSGNITERATPGNTAANFATLMHVREIAGVSAITNHAGGGSASGATISFPTVLTQSGSNFIACDGFGATSPSQTYAPLGAYGSTLTNNTSVVWSDSADYSSLASLGAVVSGSGSQTPQATGSQSNFLQGGCITFTRTGPPNNGAYFFGLYRYFDLAQSGDFPLPSTITNGYTLAWNSTLQAWQPVAAGGNMTGSGAATLNGILVANNIGTPLATAVMPSAAATVDSSGDIFGTDMTATGPVTSQSDGTHAGFLGLAGNTTLPSLIASEFHLIGPAMASFTAYGWQVPAAENSTAGMLYLGAASSHVSLFSFISQSGSKCYPFMGTSGTGCDNPSGTLSVSGSSGDLQTNNGSSNLGTAHINDNGTTMKVSESVTPSVAAADNLGTAPLPWGDGYFGGAANHSFHFDTSAVASNVAVAVPNHASNTVQGIANPSDTEYVNYIGTDGVQNRLSLPATTYTWGFVFPGVPTASAYALRGATATCTIPANFTTPTTTASCGTNPTSNTVFTLKDGATTYGTVTLSSACAATLATSGGATKSVTVDDRLQFIAPGTPDATAADIIIQLRCQ